MREVACLTALAMGGLAGCRSNPPGDSIEVVVEVPADLVISCADVVASTPPGTPERGGPFPADPGGVYDVAVYPGGTLGQEVTFQAHGFLGAACDQLVAISPPVQAAFGPGTGPVTLTLGPLCDGGVCSAADGGGDAGADGGNDAGQDAGLDAGSDAGADSGTDAGFDGGADSGTDAGVDAGCTPGQSCGVNGICAADGTCATYFSSNCKPSNFQASDLPLVAGPIAISCGDTSLDTGSASVAVTTNNWCGALPAFKALSQSNGPDALVFATTQFSVDAGSRLLVTGQRPLIIVVLGGAQIDGVIDVGAHLGDGGPGASVSCNMGLGGDGAAGGQAGGGGGGGGFGTAGAAGGAPGGGGGSGGSNGKVENDGSLSPLRGGCSGGAGAGGTVGGEGGGALQVSTVGPLFIGGTVSAEGGGGSRAAGGASAGGAGGGSGGGILLEAANLGISDAGAITANGGGGAGGAGGTVIAPGHDGADGLPRSTANALGGVFDGFDSGDGGVGGAAAGPASAGAPGGQYMIYYGGGGGGGGGTGVIRVNACQACSAGPGAVISPASGGTTCQ